MKQIIAIRTIRNALKTNGRVRIPQTYLGIWAEQYYTYFKKRFPALYFETQSIYIKNLILNITEHIYMVQLIRQGFYLNSKNELKYWNILPVPYKENIIKKLKNSGIETPDNLMEGDYVYEV